MQFVCVVTSLIQDYIIHATTKLYNRLICNPVHTLAGSLIIE